MLGSIWQGKPVWVHHFDPQPTWEKGHTHTHTPHTPPRVFGQLGHNKWPLGNMATERLSVCHGPSRLLGLLNLPVSHLCSWRVGHLVGVAHSIRVFPTKGDFGETHTLGFQRRYLLRCFTERRFLLAKNGCYWPKTVVPNRPFKKKKTVEDFQGIHHAARCGRANITCQHCNSQAVQASPLKISSKTATNLLHPQFHSQKTFLNKS